MSDTVATPMSNYDDNREYKSLKKKVEKLCQLKNRWYVDQRWIEFKDTVMEKHAATDETQRYATDLLAHLKTHVFDVLMAERDSAKKVEMQAKAAEQVKAALETVAQEKSYDSHLKARSQGLEKINADYAEKKAKLDREYRAAIAKLDAQEDVVMLRRALDEVYATQRNLSRYYWKSTSSERDTYIAAVDAELATAPVADKRRARNILIG